MHNLPRILEKIERLADACRATIDASDRPIDPVPADLVIAIFFVHPDRQRGWEQGVAPEVWQRIRRLMREYEVIVIPEAALQTTPFSFSLAELQEFRKGCLLKMATLIDLRLLRRQGGRTKRSIEVMIREALEFETFRRSAEIGALISCMKACYDGVMMPVSKGAGINELATLAWMPGVPTKGTASNPNLSETHRRIALFETLRSEGEKLAVSRLPGLTQPAEAEATIAAQIRNLAQREWSRAEFETAIGVAASWVSTLMKACVYVTDVAEEKHQLSKRAKRLDEHPRRSRDGDLFTREAISKQRDAVSLHCELSALELAFIALAADVDPNIVSLNHILATPEFRIAQKLGRIGRNHQTSLDIEEIKDLRELIFDERGYADGAMFREVHAYLAECALELLPAREWLRRLDDALVHGGGLVLPD